MQSSIQILEENFDLVISRYESGESAAKLSREFNVNHETICNRLKKAGVKIRTSREANQLNNKLTSDDIAAIISYYESGSTSLELAEKYQVTHSTILLRLKKHGVVIRERSSARRKYKLNENAFDEINEESAYWAGFIMADGCVLEKKGGSKTIDITSIKTDVGHIENFGKFLDTIKPINFHKNYARLKVSSNKLANALIKFGITPRKSLTAKVAGLEFNVDFWRGVIDGDGTISDVGKYSNNSDKKRFQLLLLGSNTLMMQFADFVESVVGMKPRVLQKGNISVVTIRGKTAAKVVQILYGKCVIALPRKLKRAKKMISASSIFLQCCCQKCGHSWFPNINNLKPKTCTKCRTKNWKASNRIEY